MMLSLGSIFRRSQTKNNFKFLPRNKVHLFSVMCIRVAVIGMHKHHDGGCSRGSQEREKEEEWKWRGERVEREIADCGNESLGPGSGGTERPLVHFH